MTFRSFVPKRSCSFPTGLVWARQTIWSWTPRRPDPSLQLLGRPRFFGLLGRDATLTIPWEEIDKIGVDAVLVRTELPPPEPKPASFWQTLRHWLDG